MSLWKRFFSRRKHMMEALDEDIRDFIERETQDNIDRGMPPEEARYAALRKFGNVTRVREDTRDVWTFVWLEQLWQDVRFGARMLLKSPGFTAVAVLTLALGIGANTAIFSLLDQTLLRSLPVKDPERLVLVSDAEHTKGGSSSDNTEMVYSYPHYKDVRDQIPLFDAVIARANVPLSIAAGDIPERVAGDVVSGNFFTVLGVRPALGRVLVPEDDRVPGAGPVAVISYGYWQRHFGGDPAVVGRKVALNTYPFTIVGVAAQGFAGVEKGNNVEVFVPIAMITELDPGWFSFTRRDLMWLNIFARLKAGVSREQAESQLQAPYRPILEAEMQAIKNPRSTFRERYLRQHISLKPAAQGLNLLSQTWAKPLLVLAGLVGLVLLITCANVSGLAIAKGTGRQKELAIRLALGARRVAIVRQLLVESLLLSAAGGVTGLAVGSACCRLLIHMLPQDTGAALSSALDGRVLAFNLCVAVFAGLVCGLLPAGQALRVDAAPVLKDSSTAFASRLGQARWRGALVVGQLTLSIVLVVTASLFAVSLRNLLRANPGFEPVNVLTFSVRPGLVGYTGPRELAFNQELERRLADLPGVLAVGAARGGVFSSSDRGSNVTVEGYHAQPDEDLECAVDSVSPSFFSTLKIPLLAGRDFTEADGATAPKVALVNERFARFFFPGTSPVGHHFGFGAGNVKLDIEIVGVVRDSDHDDLREKVARFIYLPYLQDNRGYGGNMHYYLRTAANPTIATGNIRRTVQEMNSSVPLNEIMTMKSAIADSIYSDRMVAWLASAFGVLAAILAAVGLYGLISYMVTRRTNEIGIRVALGASSSAVLWLIFRNSMALIALGVGIGIVLALAATRFVSSMLYGLEATRPFIFVSATLLLASVAALAAYLPARRATKVDPMVALRYE